MKVYAVMHDERGYFVATCFTKGFHDVITLEDSWYVAIFRDKTDAQAYVSYRNLMR
jgi:hypothetical protein